MSKLKNQCIAKPAYIQKDHQNGYLLTDAHDFNEVVGRPITCGMAKRVGGKNFRRYCLQELLPTMRSKYSNAAPFTMMVISLADLCDKPLSKQSKKEWVDLCKKHEVLPEYVTKEMVKNRAITIYYGNLTMAEFYIYMCMVRYMHLQPAFVKNVLYLVKEGMDFYSAFVVGSTISIYRQPDHHILSLSRPYTLHYDKVDINSMFIPIGYAVALANYLKTYRQRKGEKLLKSRSTSFNVCTAIEAPLHDRDLDHPNLYCKAEVFLSQNLRKIILSDKGTLGDKMDAISKINGVVDRDCLKMKRVKHVIQ